MGNYEALDVAKYIVAHANQRGHAISHLKLQKILYFVQAQFLVSLDTPCFRDTIEAWDLGPVVRNVYNEYKRYGSANIYLGNFALASFMSVRERELIDLVVDECAGYSPNQLVEITHNQTPWINAYHTGKIIYNRDIQNYFRR